MHSSKHIIGSKDDELMGKKVCLCITGSVAAVRSVELARELMRHGADVFCVMSAAAARLIQPELMHWATGNPVVSSLTGECEHISLCGDVPDKVDIVLIAPCTANTIGKIAHGIDDTPVTTVASTALGSRIPLIIVPAMHASIYANPFVAESIERLKRNGIVIMEPRIAEGKAKPPETHEIVDECIRAFRVQDLKGKSILVTAGATREYLDDVRFISNPGTGRMGIAVAREAWLRGADVTVVAGHLEVPVPRYLDVVRVEGVGEMLEEVRKRAPGKDIIVLAASAGDFVVERASGKIRSEKGTTMNLAPAPKISDEVRGWNPKAKLVLFKAESNVSDAELLRAARKKMEECDADLVVANDVGKDGAGFGSETNEVIIAGKEGKIEKIKALKTEIAKRIISRVVNASS